MRRARGLTLLEVVASLVLVATSAVALLNAQGKSLEQVRVLREQETASHLARELITAWKLDPQSAKNAREGSFEAARWWSWRRTSTASLLATSTELNEITLTIYSEEPQGQRQVAEFTWLEKTDVRPR